MVLYEELQQRCPKKIQQNHSKNNWQTDRRIKKNPVDFKTERAISIGSHFATLNQQLIDSSPPYKNKNRLGEFTFQPNRLIITVKLMS